MARAILVQNRAHLCGSTLRPEYSVIIDEKRVTPFFGVKTNKQRIQKAMVKTCVSAGRSELYHIRGCFMLDVNSRCTHVGVGMILT